MFGAEDRIGCRVEWTALRERAAADRADPNDIAGTVKRHRSTIEQIASDQYDDGQRNPGRSDRAARASRRTAQRPDRGSSSDTLTQ
ncbi:DUF1488 family protein [Bradyrhizobium canariense]|uniref:Uncharacterized protein n=1 Tax=Bradyrhizobium canariense TaxID=255045 RepID=A0A1X3G3F4_9BRAD|nr:hypothetical protein BSZ22_05225 [Bradyrhizobium canariense]OSI79056.1 hypothetical protein BSZ23_16715 [Bradyrhizobium canariense]OSI91089.1 hypothetical protein BSZ25_15740 [Bradyrhizobium canariense]OSI96108.1 hypothetical protein BSZ24_05650 [Bradyrhizobium canariense]OSJ02065.1 hypothetical protein BSZ16_18890 [Bradyrhizobium canariense]